MLSEDNKDINKNHMKKLLPFLLLLLASCGADDGVYRISKGYKVPAHHYTYFTYHRIGKVTISTPHQGYIGDKWYIDLIDTKDSEHTEEISVSEDFYKSVRAGEILEIRNDSIFHR